MAQSDSRLNRKPDGALAGGKVRSDNLRPASVDPERPFPSARGVLSAAEIEALLRPDLPEPDAPRDIKTAPTPDFSDGAEAQGLDIELGQAFAARLGLSVNQSTGLALAIDVIGQKTGAFRRLLPPPETGAAYACFGSPGGDVCAALILPATITSRLVDLSCGGDPNQANDITPRALTDIDLALLRRVLTPMASLMPGGTLLCLETRSAFALSILPPTPAAALTLDIQLDGLTGSGVLCVSETVYDALQAAPVVSNPPTVAGAPPASAPAPTPLNGRLTTLLTARIASLSVPVSRLADLKPGDTLLLGLPADEPVQLLSGGRSGAVAAEGEIGRKGKRMAVRIRRRGPALR